MTCLKWFALISVTGSPVNLTTLVETNDVVKSTTNSSTTRTVSIRTALSVQETEVGSTYAYCIFGIFREIFIFANSVKRRIYHVKNSRLRHDLPASVNDGVVSTFRKGIISKKLSICEVSRK